jgi:hypothetical protein
MTSCSSMVVWLSSATCRIKNSSDLYAEHTKFWIDAQE